MLTDDEKRELIAEGREATACRCVDAPEQECGTHGDAFSKLLGAFADALEGTLTEPEWHPIVLVRAKEAGPDAKWEPTVWDPAEIETARQGWPEGEFKLARMALDESEVPDV